MTAGQKITTYNSQRAAPEPFGMPWYRRKSIRALSAQRVLASPSPSFPVAIPKLEQRTAEWRSELSIRPYRQAANLESRDKAIGKSMITISRRDSESRNEIQTYLNFVQ